MIFINVPLMPRQELGCSHDTRPPPRRVKEPETKTGCVKGQAAGG